MAKKRDDSTLFLKELFKNGEETDTSEVDYWMVREMEPFLEDADCYQRDDMKLNFHGCEIWPHALNRVFFHIIRNTIPFECDCTLTQKDMISRVYSKCWKTHNRFIVDRCNAKCPEINFCDK